MPEALPQEIANELQAELTSGDFGDLIIRLASRRSIVPTIIFTVARAANPTINLESVKPFAKAAHLFGVVGRLLDDLIDADKENSTAAKLGTERTVLLAMSIWSIAECYLAQVRFYPHDVDMSEKLHKTFLKVAAVHFEEVEKPSWEMSAAQTIERAALKTGIYMETCFEIAARLATADELVINRLATVGYKIGILEQLYNDLRDSFDGSPRRNMFRRKQFSLALAYAIESETDIARDIRDLWQQPTIDEISKMRLLELLEANGAFLSTELTLHQIYLQVAALLDDSNGDEKLLLQTAQTYLKPVGRQNFAV